MKKYFFYIFIILILCGCSIRNTDDNAAKVSLTVEQKTSYREQILKLTQKKSWVLDENIIFTNINLPAKVENTHDIDVLSKSKDIGLDFAKILGKQAIEGVANIKYSTKDVNGAGHFIFYENKLVGAYYTVGNYIYSLNEKDVFKKDVKWENTEDTNKKNVFKETQLQSYKELFYWCNDGNASYLFSYENNKLKRVVFDKGQFYLDKEISLDGLYLTDMFLKDIDKDKKLELTMLVNNSSKNEEGTSKLLAYEYGDKLKQKYSIDFDGPMQSIDFDGKDLITTSKNRIIMYSLEDGEFKKNFEYNKIGGKIRIGDIDGSGILRYILVDSSGTDIYVFEKTKNELEEIWRSNNTKPQYSLDIQLGDLNGDNVKEIYIKGKDNSTRKVILDKNGFREAKDIKEGHWYFLLDNNCDGKSEYFDMFNKSKKSIMLYKY